MQNKNGGSCKEEKKRKRSISVDWTWKIFQCLVKSSLTSVESLSLTSLGLVFEAYDGPDCNLS